MTSSINKGAGRVEELMKGGMELATLRAVAKTNPKAGEIAIVLGLFALLGIFALRGSRKAKPTHLRVVQ